MYFFCTYSLSDFRHTPFVILLTYLLRSTHKKNVDLSVAYQTEALAYR